MTTPRLPADAASGAAEAARAIFAALAEERWADAAALVHPDTTREFRERHLAHERRRLPGRGQSVEERMQLAPGMPREVAEYHARREADLVEEFPPPVLADGYAGVQTLDELEALAPQEMLARFLEAADWRYRGVRQLEHAGRTVSAETRAYLPHGVHHVLGAVADGETLAYVVYRYQHFHDESDSPREVQTLKMKRTEEGWRACSIYLGGRNAVGMRMVEWDDEPGEFPDNEPEVPA